jgi:hypothetical protein
MASGNVFGGRNAASPGAFVAPRWVAMQTVKYLALDSLVDSGGDAEYEHEECRNGPKYSEQGHNHERCFERAFNEIHDRLLLNSHLRAVSKPLYGEERMESGRHPLFEIRN